LTTFGTLPGDVLTNSRGDVQAGVALGLYATAADATASTGLLATVTTDAEGRWAYTDATRGIVWVRTSVGRVYSTLTSDFSFADAGVATIFGNPASASRVVTDGIYGLRDAVVVTAASRGVVADGTTDDTTAVNAAITACPVGGVVLLPPGNMRITTALSITKSMTLRGSAAYGSRIFADACGGVVVAAGVADFHMENIEVAAKVRYTTTTNAYIGISVLGSTGSRPTNHVYRDVYVDGFATAFRSGYLWSSVLSNFRCNYGLIGLDIYGLSVNNFVNGGSQITVAVVAGSRCIRFAGQESPTDATVVGTEGWTISGNLLFGGETGIEGNGATSITVADNILDYNQIYGIAVKENGTAFGGVWDIHDNYIAISGAGGIAGVSLPNTVANTQNTFNRVHDNRILAYAGSVCTYGVYISGTNAKSIVRGNVISVMGAADIRAQIAGNVITDNVCLTAAPSTTANIYSTFLNEVANNVGVVYWPGGSTPVAYTARGRMRQTYAAAIPTTGTWAVGDECANTVSAVGSPKAWLCTVAGTPGTWVSTGNL